MSVKEFLIKIVKAVRNEYTRLDRTCNNCGKEIFGGKTPAEELFCTDCYAHLPFNNGNVCAHCGRSTVNPEQRCNDCAGFETSFTIARSPFYYAPPIDNLIRMQKYDNCKYMARVFGVFLSEYYIKYFSDADVITFVPMTEGKKRGRGYNQAELLAQNLSVRTGTPYEELLVKEKDTERQATLNRADRLLNLKGTFKVRKGALIEGRTIVLVDDVLTTGATAEGVSSVLKKAGAKAVYVLTVASVTDLFVAKALGQERSSSSLKRAKKKLKAKKG